MSAEAKAVRMSSRDSLSVTVRQVQRRQRVRTFQQAQPVREAYCSAGARGGVCERIDGGHVAGAPFPIQRIIVVLVVIAVLGSIGPSSARESIAPVRPSAFFVVNAGQEDARVRFAARGARHAIFATDRGITLALAPSDSQRMAIDLALVAATPRRIEPSQPGDTRVHFLTGRDSRNWKRNLVAYRGRVRVSRRVAGHRCRCWRRPGPDEV